MNNFWKKLIAITLGIFVALFLLEIACQAFFIVSVSKQLESQRNDPLHYYQASSDPIFRYELKPGYRMEKDGRRIRINDQGIRDDEDQSNRPRKIALLGDSVPFGISLSQEETPPARLQLLTGDSIKVLNFGTPGYGLEEIVHFLEKKFPVYQPQKVIYVLNLNDFSRRNTIYEGADNGLYRIYHRPFFKLPFFIRKAVYRYIKQGKMSSVKWYRWMFEGNKTRLLPLLNQMAGYAKSNGSEFSILLFPPAVAYENGNFALQDIFDEITGYCRENGIPVIAPVAEFSQNVYDLQDNTDHCTPKGCEVMAHVIHQQMQHKAM